MDETALFFKLQPNKALATSKQSGTIVFSIVGKNVKYYQTLKGVND